MRSKKREIAKFYRQIFLDSKLKKRVEEEAKKIEKEEDLKKLLHEEIMPLMKRHNVNFLEDELINYEEKSLKELSKEALESVGGGVSLKSAFLTGGILSMALLGSLGLNASAMDPVTSSQGQAGTTNSDARQSLSYTKFSRSLRATAKAQTDHILSFLGEYNIEDLLERLDDESLEILKSDVQHVAEQIEKEDFGDFGYNLLLKGKWSENRDFNNSQLQKILDLNSALENIIAHGACGTGVNWQLTQNATLTVFGNGDMSSSASITSDQRSGIKKVVIKKGVKSIADGAFSGYSGGTYIEIPDSVVSIGDGAFSGCIGLTSIEIPNSVTSIGDAAFADCRELTSVKYDGTTCIEDLGQFAGCKVTGATVPSNYEAETFCGLNINREIDFTDTNNQQKTNDDAENEEQATVDKQNDVALESENDIILDQKIEQKNTTNDQHIVQTNEQEITGNQTNTVEQQNAVIPKRTSQGNDKNSSNVIVTQEKSQSNVTPPEKQQEVNQIVASGTCGETANWELDDKGTLTISGNGWITDTYKLLDLANGQTFEKDKIKKVVIENGIIGIEDRDYYLDHLLFNCPNLTELTIPESVKYIGNEVFYACNKLKIINYMGTKENDINFGGYSWDWLQQPVVNVPKNYVGDEFDRRINVRKTLNAINREGQNENNLIWNLDQKGKLTISGKGDIAYYNSTIPKDKVKSINIENGVTAIEDYVFRGFENLAEVNISSSVKSIGKGSFKSCLNLTNITISDNVTFIGESAFKDCRNLVKIKIPNKVTFIGKNAFRDCRKITDITIPATLKSIEPRTFCDCFDLKKVTISSSVTEIKAFAFFSCRSLTTIKVPSNINCIGENAFANSGLIQVELSRGITSIENEAFRGTSLKKITIPSSVNFIGDSVFEGCKQLSRVEYFGKKDIEHGKDVFKNCKSLDPKVTGKIVYPKARAKLTTKKAIVPTDYKGDSFCGRSVEKILEVVMARGQCGKNVNWELDIEGTLTISGNGEMDDFASYSSPFYNYRGKIKKVVINDGVRSIGNCAFKGFSKELTEVTISDSVTSIGEEAFRECNNLSIIKISKNLNSIGDKAFFGCANLNEINLPQKLTFIGKQAFYCCMKLEKITIPPKVTSIKEETFWWCSKLTKIEIPSSVTSIEGGIFKDCKKLAEVIIPSTVASIGNSMFYGCENLTQIKIPNSVTSIGSSAFNGCPKLTEIEIPSSVKSIGAHAFYNSGLTQIKINNGVTSIGMSAFASCTKLTEIEIPTNVTSIGDNAFQNCLKLEEVTIQSNNVSIGAKVFDGCIKLTKITVQRDLESVGSRAFFTGYNDNLKVEINGEISSAEEGAFYGCKGLTEIKISENATSIGKSAFSNCKDLTKIKILGGASIGESAFSDCENLIQIEISKSLNPIAIKADAFRGCSKLTEITIPHNITSIGDRAFSNCSKINYVGNRDIEKYGKNVFEDGAVITVSDDYEDSTFCGYELTHKTESNTPEEINWELDKDGTLTISGKGKMDDYSEEKPAPWWQKVIRKIVVGPGITSIGTNAFKNCEYLAKLTIKGIYITSVGESAFENCPNLSEITIPTSVTSIGKSAFAGSGLSKVKIPSSVTSIGANAFKNCKKLTDITIPSSVTSIGKDAFENCKKLTNITIPTSVTSIEEGAFDGSGITQITIPTSVTSIGKYAFSHCKGLTQIAIPTSVTSIEEGVFAGSGITQIMIPTSVTSIGKRAFAFSGLTQITIPSSVTSIGEDAFAGSGLTQITIPTSVTSIGANAFRNCVKLTNIKIPTSVTSIEEGTFAGSGINQITIPFGVMSIGKSAFSNCKGLTQITIPTSVTSISDDAFDDSGLTQIIITSSTENPSQLAFIGKSAFRKCNGLTQITLPRSVTSIGDNAFFACENLETINYTGLNEAKNCGKDIFGSCPKLKYITVPIDYEGEKCFTLTAQKDQNVVAEQRLLYSGNCGQPEKPDDVRWWLDERGILTILGKGKMQDYFENSSKGTVSPFNAHKDKIKKVVISDGIEYIGSYAFYNCNSLSEIEISKTVTSIGKGAFKDCTGLESITIPDGVTSIENDTFANCANLNEVIITGNIKSVGDYAFLGCNIYKISFPEGLESIGGWAFGDCSKLKKVEIPKTVTFIGEKAFAYCDNLVKVTVPKDLLKNWDKLFDHNCSCVIKPTEEEAESPAYHKITTTPVSFEDSSEGNASVDGFTLSGFCGEEESEESVKWEYTKKNVSRRSTGPFSVANETVTVEGTLTISYTGTGSGKIGNIPIKEIMHFDKNKFENAPNDWPSIDKEQANCPPLNEITKIIINNGVTSIGDCAFSGCNKLKKVIIPNTVISIGNSAFSGCLNLNEVNRSSYAKISIPSSVKSIGKNAFFDCGNLQTITVAKGTSLGESALGDCNNKINESENDITYGMSSENNTTQSDSEFSGFCGAAGNEQNVRWEFIKKVNSRGEEKGILRISGTGKMRDVPLIHKNEFINSSYCLDILSESSNWYSLKEQIDEIIIEDGITSIGDFAFAECKNLKSIKLPTSVTSIGMGAFYRSGLETIDMPRYGVESIGGYAFAYCKLKEINIPINVDSIEDGTFWWNGRLTTVNIPSVESVGDNAFAFCEQLNKINYSKNLMKSVGKNACYNCKAKIAAAVPLAD